MSSQKSYLKNKFFLSLFAVLLIFIISSTLSLGFLYFNNIEKKMTSIYSQYNEDLLYQSKSLVEHIYTSLNENGNQIYNNESALKLAYSNDPLSMKDQLHLQDWIQQIKSSSPMIHSVSLHIQKSDKIYDTNYGYCNFVDFPDHQWITDNNQWSSFKVVMDEKRTLKNSTTDFLPTTQVLSFMYTLPYTSNYRNKIIINIDIDAIHKEVMSRLQNSSDIVFAIINDQNRIILGDDKEQIINSILHTQLSYSDEGQELTTSYNEESYLVNALPSDLYDWNFIWIDSTTSLNNIFTNLRLTLLFGSLMMLVLIITIAIYVAKKVTRPMDELLNRIPLPEKGIHFIQDMKRNIENTLSENITIHKELEKTSSIYKERTLYSLLMCSKNILA